MDETPINNIIENIKIPDVTNEFNINFYLILGIILIIIIILNVYNFKSQTIDLNKDPIELIKETHKICPVMNNQTNIISCVRYSPLNEGFIVSVCCKDCINEIQSSFDSNDGKYIIREENDMNILYNYDKIKQITPICNSENFKLVSELTGNKIMD